jgi:predicted O-methyltransferase YrrM
MPKSSQVRTYEFDPRHLVPMAYDFLRLATVGLMSKKRRPHVIGVGRSIRAHAFEAWDDFRSISLDQVAGFLGATDEQIVLPPLNTLRGGGFGLALYVVLATVVRAVKPNTILEFGTYRGVGTLTMALNAPQSEIVTVDLPSDFETADILTLTRGDKEWANIARGSIGMAFLDHVANQRIRMVKANSLTLDATTIVDSVDFCFIDGGHSYECIKADTENALKVVSRSGVIMWDDYAWFVPGVHKYLREIARDRPLVRIAETQYVLLAGASKWSKRK